MCRTQTNLCERNKRGTGPNRTVIREVSRLVFVFPVGGFPRGPSDHPKFGAAAREVLHARSCGLGSLRALLNVRLAEVILRDRQGLCPHGLRPHTPLERFSLLEDPAAPS